MTRGRSGVCPEETVAVMTKEDMLDLELAKRLEQGGKIGDLYGSGHEQGSGRLCQPLLSSGSFHPVIASAFCQREESPAWGSKGRREKGGSEWRRARASESSDHADYPTSQSNIHHGT